MNLINDETGNVYAKLTVLYRVENDNRGNACWRCQCSCGNQKTIPGARLRGGHTRSCGCLVKETARKLNVLPFGEAAQNNLYLKYKRCAKIRGYEWGISKVEFLRICQQKCAYCGILPSQISRTTSEINGNFLYNGIDRVDNSVGYYSGNVVPCCKVCNIAKSTQTLGQFTDWIRRVYDKIVA